MNAFFSPGVGAQRERDNLNRHVDSAASSAIWLKLIAHDLGTTNDAAEGRFVHYRPTQVHGLVGVAHA